MKNCSMNSFSFLLNLKKHFTTAYNTSTNVSSSYKFRHSFESRLKTRRDYAQYASMKYIHWSLFSRSPITVIELEALI